MKIIAGSVGSAEVAVAASRADPARKDRDEWKTRTDRHCSSCEVTSCIDDLTVADDAECSDGTWQDPQSS
eukprot:CAMPEP_0119304060 /NCGR_PEP_ID=MMETSP1333-20130426/5383_1 /TAXON_ID=418940 /ORGANISM="Scyphosphaera apsteinii, Strain RCC1455" /LENGTH=69 /DNA_ID=CAMNT_0007306871 /DNA_START=66 /DNA_END=272 /DNA_ORIENTATION=-